MSEEKQINWKRVGWAVGIAIVILAIVILLWWWFFGRTPNEVTRTIPRSTTKTSTPSATSSTKKGGTEGWKDYSNEKFKISVKYPKEVTVEEEELDQDDHRVIFKNKKGEDELEIMIFTPPRLKTTSISEFIQEEIGYASSIESTNETTIGENTFTKVEARDQHGTKIVSLVILKTRMGLIFGKDLGIESAKTFDLMMSTIRFD